MSLKPQPDRKPSESPPPPTWGELADAGEQVGVIRFECAAGDYSFPYHVLSRWALHAGPPESLIIQAGKDTVTVHGRQLSAVRDALEAGRLRVLRATSPRYPPVRSGPEISALIIESAD
jgi:hypothetical protein